MRNNIKAMVYVTIGITTAILSIYGLVIMYFSGTFLPVYVGNVFVLRNKILRIALYIILLVITVLSAKVADYGVKFLIKKLHKIRRR